MLADVVLYLAFWVRGPLAKVLAALSSRFAPRAVLASPDVCFVCNDCSRGSWASLERDEVAVALPTGAHGNVTIWAAACCGLMDFSAENLFQARPEGIGVARPNERLFW